MAKALKTSTFAEFSAKFVRFHGLPFGCELKLWRDKSERYARNDMLVKRKGINRKNCQPLSDDQRIRELLDEAERMLSMDLKARGLTLWLTGPDGSSIDTRTHTGTVRAMEAAEEPYITDGKAIFQEVIESCGLDDVLSVKQSGALYSALKEICGDELDDDLLNWRDEIR